WARQLRKVELHAHVNGSIHLDALRELAARKGVPLPEHIAMPGSPGFSLDDVFALFSNTVYSVVNDPESLGFVVDHVLRSFASDGVTYIELRTTPRAVAGVMNLEEYVSAIVGAFVKHTASGPSITAKVLLSIDRRHNADTAAEIVNLALSFPQRFPDIVIGLDVCGNPARGGIAHLKPSLLRFKRHARNLKLVIHFDEIAEPPEEDELKAILACFPDRLGHCTFVPTDVLHTMRERRIPIEICLSSNVICSTVDSFEGHHLKELWNSGYPRECLILCTDDVGIFCSELSNEYVIARRVLGLSRREMEEWAALVYRTYAN
ncbi:hypothetical protein BC830DRAFT_1067214, partial [Chytriomyces sp. MP71]